MSTPVDAVSAPRPGHLPFTELGVSDAILKAVAQLGFEEASPIQSAAIPVIMSGVDIVGQSQTGSGKTAAFAIPAIELVDTSSKATQVLIMCPTRELATQVAEEVHKLAAFKKGLHSVPIFGGASYERQFFELKKGAQIVVGTPGRIMDHIDRGTLDLRGIKMVILDEADRMLDMGFRDDIEKILGGAPKERQTIFFSATVSTQIQSLIRRNSKNPQTIKVEQKAVTGAPKVEQLYFEVRNHAKFEALVRLIDFYDTKIGVIFCNTQRTVDELADALIGRGYSADRLHGGIPQAQRTRVMNNFKASTFEFLVATDVAARGIDVNDLELVVNFDLPYDAEDYVHRIGRTGRAGRAGRAITFVSGSEIYKLQNIERYTKAKIHRETVPSLEQVDGKRADAMFNKIQAILEAGQFTQHTAFIDRLLEQGHSATDVASALLAQLVGGEGSGAGSNSPGAPAARESKAPRTPREPREDTRGEVPSRARPAGSSASDASYSSGPGLSGLSALETARAYAASQGKVAAAPKKAAVKTGSWTGEAAPAAEASAKPTKAKPAKLAPAPAAPADPDALPRATAGKQWMAVDIGIGDALSPSQVVDLIVGGTELSRKTVGTIKFEQSQSYIEIERESMPKVLAHLAGVTLKGRKLMPRSMFAAIKAKKSGKW